MKYYLIENDTINSTTTDEPDWLKEIITGWKTKYKLGGRAITTDDNKKSLIIAPEEINHAGLEELTREEADALIKERIPERVTNTETFDENGEKIIEHNIVPAVKIEYFENKYLGFAQNHSGAITVSESWTLANSPHHITGSVTVSAGATLTIDAGCEVIFDGFYGIYLGSGTAGKLIMIGTATNRIVIRGLAPQLYNFWNIISIVIATSEYTAKFCDILNGTNSINFGASPALFVCENNYFANCAYALRTSFFTATTTITVKDCFIDDSTNGLQCLAIGIYNIINCKFTNVTSPFSNGAGSTLVVTDCYSRNGNIPISATTGTITINNYELENGRILVTTMPSVTLNNSIIHSAGIIGVDGMKFVAAGNMVATNCDISIKSFSIYYGVKDGGSLVNCALFWNFGAWKTNFDLTADASGGGVNSTSTPTQFINVNSVSGMRSARNFTFTPANIVLSGLGFNGCTIDFTTDFRSKHRIKIGTVSGIYTEIFDKDWNENNYNGLQEIVTKTPSFILNKLKPRTKYYYLCETYDPVVKLYNSSAEGNFTTTEYYLLNELELYNNKVRYSSTAGEVMQINGRIQTDFSTIGAIVNIVVRKKSDDSLVATLFNGAVDFSAGVDKTITQINGGVQLTWTTAVALEYYIQLTITGGTPSIFAGIENQIEAEFEYFRSDDVIITNPSASNYFISRVQATEFSCNLVNATGAFVIVNNKEFKLAYDIISGKWKATVYGFSIGVCAAQAIKFYGYNDYFITDANAPNNLTVTLELNYDIAGMEAQIVSILSAITDLKTVIAYEPKEIPELPALTLFFDGFEQSQTEAVSFTVNYKWIMRLYVRLLDAKIAQDDMKSLTQKILAALKINLNINGLAYFSLTPSAAVSAILDKNNPVLLVEFNFTASKEED